MAALEQEVGGGHHPAVRRGQHGGVVTDPDHRPRPGGHPLGHLGDEPEFAQLTDARAIGVFAGNAAAVAVFAGDAGLPANSVDRAL
jgi:hypothetical protein